MTEDQLRSASKNNSVEEDLRDKALPKPFPFGNYIPVLLQTYV